MASLEDSPKTGPLPPTTFASRLRGDRPDAPSHRERPQAAATPIVLNDEALVVDERSALRPAQMVENKLSRMLKDASMPVSHLQMRGLIRAR